MSRIVPALVCLFFIVCAAVLYLYVRTLDGEQEYVAVAEESRVVADAIRAHDRSLKIDWTHDDKGHPDIVVREVFDTAQQNQIIEWAKSVKNEGCVHRLIVISFQHEIPHSDQPDVMLREVEF